MGEGQAVTDITKNQFVKTVATVNRQILLYLHISPSSSLNTHAFKKSLLKSIQKSVLRPAYPSEDAAAKQATAQNNQRAGTTEP